MRHRTMADQWTLALARRWLERPVDLHDPMSAAAHLGTGQMIVQRLIGALEREENR